MARGTFTSPMHIVIPDSRLRFATRIVAARKGVTIRAYVEGMLRDDAEISSALDYADSGAAVVATAALPAERAA